MPPATIYKAIIGARTAQHSLVESGIRGGGDEAEPLSSSRYP